MMKKICWIFLSVLFAVSTTTAQNHVSQRLRSILGEYHHFGPVAENGLVMVCKDDTEHCGCIDTLGNEVIPFIYGMNFFYFMNEPPVFNSVNRMVAAKPLGVTQAVYGIIDDKGKTILPFKYKTEYHNFHPLDAYHVFKTYNEPHKYGVVDSLGNIIIPFEYDKIEKVGTSFFITKEAEKYGILNSQGQVVLAKKFSSIFYNEMYNLVFVQQNNLWGVYTPNGKKILPINYTSINFSAYRHLVASTENTIVFFNVKGEQIKLFDVDFGFQRTNAKGRLHFPMVFQHNNKKGMINTQLEISVPFEYESISLASYLVSPYQPTPVYRVKKNGKETYIDTANSLLSGIWFDTVFYNGLVKKDSLWGWVNGQGKLQIPVEYENLIPIRVVEESNTWTSARYYFATTKKGVLGLLKYEHSFDHKWAIPFSVGLEEIHSIYHPKDNEDTYVIAKKEGKFGVVYSSGEQAIPFEYDSVESDFNLFEHFKFGHYRFYKGKKRFLVDWNKLEMVKE